MHALGEGKANQTGHDGDFTEGGKTKFNNKYYRQGLTPLILIEKSTTVLLTILVSLYIRRMMLDNGTVWRQVLSEPTADNPVAPEWHWDGYSALDDSKGPFLNDDRGVLGFFDNPPSFLHPISSR